MTRFYPKDSLTERGHALRDVGLDGELPEIRRNPATGQIDYAYYLARARRERSKAFHRLAPALVGAIATVIPGRELFRRKRGFRR